MAQTTFDTVGSHTYIVPSGVEEIEIALDGAGGGSGGTAEGSSIDVGSGGNGGRVVVTVPVSGGETLDVYVGGGGNGGEKGGTGENLGDGGNGGGPSWNRGGGGGGGGNDGTNITNYGAGGGGGGGATAVVDSSGTVLASAGAGGGGGGDRHFNSEGGGGGGGGARGGSGGAGGFGNDLNGNPGDNGDGSGSGGTGGDGHRTVSNGSAGGYVADGGVTVESSSSGGGAAGGSAPTSQEVDGNGGANGQVVIEEAPPAPSLSLQNVTSSSIDLDIGDTSDEDGVRVYRRETGGSFSQIDSLGAGVAPTVYTDSGVSEGESYDYYVEAFNGAGASTSPTRTATTTLPAPTLDSVTNPSGDDLDVAWTLNSTDEDGVRVFRSRDGGTTLTQIADLAAGTTSYSDTGLLDGEEYTYEVRTYTEHVESASGQQSATTVLPDAQQPTADASVEDELTITWTDVTDYGNYDLQLRESNESQSWGVTADLTVGEGTTSQTITGLEDGEQYDVRLRTRTEHVTGAWASITDITLLPADTGLTITGRENTIDASVTDTADNEDGRRLQRSTDGGSTWTTVDDVGANVTSVADASPPLYEQLQYRSQVYTEHVVANSATVSTVAVRDSEFYAELGPETSPTIVLPDNIERLGNVSLEHTALHGWEFSVAPGDRDYEDFALGDARIYIGSEQVIKGVVQRVAQDQGTTTLAGVGPGIQLRENRTEATYANIRGDAAIRDYLGQIATVDSYTVTDAFARSIETDEQIYDAPAVQGFDSVVSATDDEPLVASGSDLRLAQTAFFEEAEDGSGAFTTATDVAIDDRFSAGEAAELSTAGQNVEVSFTLDHRIPADDVEIQARIEWQSFEGEIYAALDGQDVGYIPSEPQSSKTIEWRDFFNLAANATVDSISDLQPGTHTVEIRVEQINSTFSGSLFVDAIVPYDTGSRFGGFSYTFDNTVEDPNARLSGPAEYPATYDARVSFDEVWHVPSAELTISTTDGSTSPRLALSPNASQFVTAANTNSLAADFDAAGYVGTDVVADVRLARQDSGNAQSPSSGDATQVVDDLVLTADTDDLPLIESLTLDGETHFDNLQTLCAENDFRFVVDPQADGLVIDAFRRADAAVAKSGSWTTVEDGVDGPERDTEGYYNELQLDGDGTSVTLRYIDEQSRIASLTGGDGLVRRAETASISDPDELANEARRRIRRAVGNDELRGSLEVVPTLILPGYPYTPAEFDGDQVSLESVQFSLEHGSVSATLEFGRRRGWVSALGR